MQRFHYTVKQKLQILDLIESGQIFRLSTLFPSISQKQINEWQEKQGEMRQISDTKKDTTYTLHSGPPQKYPELFQFLHKSVKELRQQKRAVTVDYLQSLAEIEEPSIKHLSKSGKRSLIERFMVHFGLSI